MGNPPPGVPPFETEKEKKICIPRNFSIDVEILPGDDAHEGAILILGVIRVLSDKRRLGNAALATRR